LPADAVTPTLRAMHIVARLLNALIARWQRGAGRLAQALGRTAAARRHYERALACGGDAFEVHLALARLAFTVGDYPAWRRHLDRARVAAPDRYARLVDPARGTGPRLAGTSVAPPRPPVEAGAGARATAEDRAAFDAVADGDAPTRDEFVDAAPPAHDDFASAHERARFRRLGPIAPAEVKRCDLDDLLKRLGG
jgi:tetratricopeptide (TPR) repeat protein